MIHPEQEVSEFDGLDFADQGEREAHCLDGIAVFLSSQWASSTTTEGWEPGHESSAGQIPKLIARRLGLSHTSIIMILNIATDN